VRGSRTSSNNRCMDCGPSRRPTTKVERTRIFLRDHGPMSIPMLLDRWPSARGKPSTIQASTMLKLCDWFEEVDEGIWGAV